MNCYQFKGGIATFLKLNGRKKYCLLEFIYYFLMSIYKRNVYILKPCREIVYSFQGSQLHEDRLDKDLKTNEREAVMLYHQ